MRQRISRVVLLALAALLVVPVLGGIADAKKKKKKSVPVTVMTRNIFLGADLSPALQATSFQEFTSANGKILRDVDQTNFPLRAQGLAKEIRSNKPDLVGIQEGAWWRTNPTPGAPVQGESTAYTALTSKYEFIQLLLDELNENKTEKYKGYKLAIVGTEFDFEAPTDYDNNPSTGLFGGEIQGRLTMRDAILVRKGGAVKVENPRSGHFQNLYTPNVAGIPVAVTRGWVAVDATAKKGEGKNEVTKKFTFVNTHFEAFDDETQRPSIRALQAQELVSGGGQYGEGPASAKKVILLGDFNSNVPGVQPGDEQAFQVLLDAGFTRRATSDPLSCCVSNLFTSPPSEFDHQVDHIMTNRSKKKVKLVNSSVTGLAQVNGIYDSDHAGVVSRLKLR